MRLRHLLRAAPLLALLAQPLAAQTPPQPHARITVTGTGDVAAAPDMATISLGVVARADAAGAAMASMSERLTQVIATLKAAGVAARDLQTSDLSLNPNMIYGQNGEAGRIDGYTASSTVTIRVRALESLGATLDAAVKDGANTLNGVTFGLADPAPRTDEARRRAVADARHRAELYAEAAGVRLGRVEEIGESGRSPAPPMFRMADAQTASVPVEAGEVTLGASVTITWSLEE